MSWFDLQYLNWEIIWAVSLPVPSLPDECPGHCRPHFRDHHHHGGHHTRDWQHSSGQRETMLWRKVSRLYKKCCNYSSSMASTKKNNCHDISDQFDGVQTFNQSLTWLHFQFDVIKVADNCSFKQKSPIWSDKFSKK